MEFFEHYFDNGGLHLKYARCAPSVRERELHDYHEFVFFLGGRARFVSKSVRAELSEGSVLWIPRNAFHLFEVEGSDYERCILRFYETSALSGLVRSLGGEIRMIDSPSPLLSSLIAGITNTASAEISAEEKSLYLYSAIVQLLFEFKSGAGKSAARNISVSNLVSETLAIVDAEYAAPLSIEGIAAALHVSKSLLFHTFKKEMGISVYQYISRKRLSVARDLIASGVPITSAATQSGFSDYSCFLRMYKARFGCVPSAAPAVTAEHPFA